MNNITNNKIAISGIVKNKPSLHHEMYGEKFYQLTVDVNRLSESKDTLEAIVSERILFDTISEGDKIYLSGQIRTFNNVEEEKKHLKVYLFVEEYKALKAEESTGLNSVKLSGFICREPRYRKLESGREVTDVILAVNRGFKKSDYIPTILWGRNAAYVKSLAVGTEIEITGRFQSREYIKLVGENKVSLITHEVSTSKVVLKKKEEQ